MKVNLFPTVCNLCKGEVVYTSNADIYGKEYGSGKCYRCLDCGAYVGTHKPRPKEAFGLLSDERMRDGRKKCHGLFDRMWKTKFERVQLYNWLAEQLDIKSSECHFGYFDINMLLKAHKVLCIEFKRRNPNFKHCYERKDDVQ